VDNFDYTNTEEDQEMCVAAGITFTMQETSMSTACWKAASRRLWRPSVRITGPKFDLKVVVNNMSGNINL
jgi:hypothetical protein